MAKKNELIKTAKSLGIETKDLTVAQLEKAIAEKEAVADTTEKETKETAEATATENASLDTAVETNEETASTPAPETPENSIPNSFTLEDGRVFGLSKRTPKTLKVLDGVYTQEELLQNKDAMEFLIFGGSSFVTQLK